MGTVLASNPDCSHTSDGVSAHVPEHRVSTALCPAVDGHYGSYCGCYPCCVQMSVDTATGVVALVEATPYFLSHSPVAPGFFED